ncbi:PP2C family protein-serine/threonine phosphatase [Desulfopila sp. IMCC35008]|uniref:PP2C family protein-serine/threonine phosphatase n=1 Tax=Desulfopila sp. IMCC35008 TaxID=2653858 RepID=UPI0013D3C795|nr:SpoIIE family protein phosphatase [Desulfopila sp. IMCC35008]
MASLSPVHLGTIIGSGFLPLLLLRPFLANYFVNNAVGPKQPKRAFILDFCICTGAAAIINIYNLFNLGFPAVSLISLFIGCVISGFFIGLNSSLRQERHVILQAMKSEQNVPVPKRFFPMTRKFSYIAVTTSLLVSLVLIMVFTRDVEWLATTARDADSISDAKMSVIFEIFFIMGVLLILLMNLIFSYSKNLRLLFNNETQILEKVQKGDLSNKVPIATNDEFGIIAGHTNHMIDGLRHRFELINALKLAEEVQQNLLPTQSPFLPGYDISGASLYCDQTGGDYYDYLLLSEHKVGIVVADVCGHGIGAAMLMTSIRAFLISAIRSYSNPAELLNRINISISRDCAISGRFTSMFFLEIDHQDDRLRWVRAGHEPAICYHQKSGKFTKLEGDGLVLGVEESYTYTNNTSRSFSQGDIILVGTDGIHETRNSKDELFGQERVQHSISTHSHESARVIQQALVDEVIRFRGDMPQEDDITLVVIKVK